MAEARVRTRRSSVPTPEERDSASGGRTVTFKLFGKNDVAPEDSLYDEVRKASQSLALTDPFLGIYMNAAGTLSVIAPEFNPQAVIKLPNESSGLRQCIEAYVTNICSFGWRLEYIGPEEGEDGPASLAEKDRIESLINQPNGEYTFIELKERVRRDLETFGYAFMEVGRLNDGSICMLNHVPAHTVRMTAKEMTQVPVDTFVQRKGQLKKVRVMKRYRRFVQMVGSRLVYFKEFGDPRQMNPRTGLEDKTIGYDDSATEIYHFQIYTPGSPYGLPRWINQLPSIQGTRESELTNLSFFRENAIPAMAVLVSGGALTNASLSNIEAHFLNNRGRQAANRVLVIEATGDDTSGSMDGTVPAPKIEMKPLTSERQQDGSFLKYEEANEAKIRGAFRLPPIFVGRSSDYTRATAETSMTVTDSQVFSPERNKDDEVWNSHFLTEGGKPLQYWQLRSNPPRIVQPEDIIDALSEFQELGAMTPNIAIGIANEMFDLNLRPIEHAWGDYPFSIVQSLANTGNLAGVEEIMMGITGGVDHGLSGEDEAQPIAPVASTGDDEPGGNSTVGEIGNPPSKKSGKLKFSVRRRMRLGEDPAPSQTIRFNAMTGQDRTGPIARARTRTKKV